MVPEILTVCTKPAVTKTNGASIEVTVEADLYKALAAVSCSILPPCKMQSISAKHSIAANNTHVNPIHRMTVDPKPFIRSKHRDLAAEIMTRHAEPRFLIFR